MCFRTGPSAVHVDDTCYDTLYTPLFSARALLLARAMTTPGLNQSEVLP